MHVTPIRTRIFSESEDLAAFIIQHIKRLKNGAVLVVTSKIVALAEGRTAIAKDAEAKDKLIRSESDWARKTKFVMLTIKDGVPMANAGIDDSNAKGRLILLPKDSFRSATIIRKELQKHYGIKKLGVVITDSRVMPLRAGVTGVALGYAGFKGVRDYRGTPDIFGRKLKFTQTDIADSLATAAVLTMGEGRECRPLCVIEDAPVVFHDKVDRDELRIDIKDDMYRPLFRTVAKRKKR